MSQITVVIPVNKVEAYICRCIDSVLNQTFRDFDVILINDQSPDGCGAICNAYVLADARVHVIHHPYNMGLSAARNTGIEWAFTQSDSNWITFIDSDDWVHPLYLEALLYAAQGHGISVCYRTITHGEELAAVDAYSFTLMKPEDYYLNYMGNSTVAWGKLYTKESFRDIRYPVGKLNEDEYVTYKLLFRFSVIPFIPQQLYKHLLNPDSIMHQSWNYRRLDALDAFEDQLDFFASNGYLTLAENRFRAIIKINLDGQKKLASYEGLSEKKRNHLVKKLRRQLQRILIRYRKNRWISVWNRGEDLWIYSKSFAGFHAVHMLWRKLKSYHRSG